MGLFREKRTQAESKEREPKTLISMSFVTPSFSDLCSGTVRSTLPPPKKRKEKQKQAEM